MDDRFRHVSLVCSKECANYCCCQTVSIENYPTNNRFDISALSAIDNDANEELTYRLSSNQVLYFVYGKKVQIFNLFFPITGSLQSGTSGRTIVFGRQDEARQAKVLTIKYFHPFFLRRYFC